MILFQLRNGSVDTSVVFGQDVVVAANSFDIVEASGHTHTVLRVFSHEVDLGLIELIQEFDRVAGEEELGMLRVEHWSGEKPKNPRDEVLRLESVSVNTVRSFNWALY